MVRVTLSNSERKNVNHQHDHHQHYHHHRHQGNQINWSAQTLKLCQAVQFNPSPVLNWEAIPHD